jgi:hypothetical protein
MDEHGNRNNVIHVKPASDLDSSISASDPTTTKHFTSETAQQEQFQRPIDDRKDSTMDSVHLPEVPVPFVTVDKVADKEQPSSSDVEPSSLPSDASKRAADAIPDYEELKVDPPTEAEPPKSPEVPHLIVERTDDKPAYGEDFGKNATTAQRIAHEMRAADASPDELLVSPEIQGEPDSTDEQAAPLFRHESTQSNEPLPASALETLDDESAQSSTDHTSTGDAINTPSEPDNEEDDDELSHGPVLNHETGLDSNRNDEECDEFDQAPLLSHETGFPNGNGPADEDYDDEDEFDKAPLLSHETGFSDYNASEINTNSDYLEEDTISEPRHYGPYGDEEDDYNDVDDNDAPLLPHERGSAVASNAGSDDGHFSFREQPTFDYETEDARELFGGSGRANIFRSRTNSSTLPHKLPRSDAEDDNLHDPSLERFPTNREQILERVASIGLHLPEDETVEEHPHSPPMSVLSQACSSVDLAPVKSYASLASVPEADFSDDEDNGDVDSLPSPIYISGRTSNPPSGFARDPNATPMPDDSKQLGFIQEDQAEEQEGKPEMRSNHTADSSEAGSLSKHDGARDASRMLASFGEAIATPARMFNPITPPLTPDRKSTPKQAHPVANLDAELRERRRQTETTEQSSEAAPAATASDDNDTKNVLAAETAAPTQQSVKHNKNFLQNFTRVVFGPIGRFLTACASDRKRAR